MVRVAIIDHSTHQLFIEDISEEMIEKYGGEEEYIVNTYGSLKDSEWSWDYITDCFYYCEENSDGINVEFSTLL